MVMNQEKLMKAYPSMPEDVRQRVDDTLLRLRTESAAGRMAHSAPRRKLSFALVLVLALMIAAAGTAAGIHLGVFDFMTNLFGQSGVLPEAEQLVASDLANVSLPNSALAVEEAVYDGGNLRIVYSVRSTNPALSIEEAAEADGISLYGCDSFFIGGEERYMTNGSAYASRLSPEGDRWLCYLDIYLASSGIVPEGDFTVGLPLTGKDPVTFTVPGYQVAADPVQTETDTVRVTMLSASLSPVRSYARLRIEKLPGVSVQRFEAALGDWKDAYLVDAEGNTLSAPVEILTGSSEEGQWIDLTYIFQPIKNEAVFFAPTLITPENEWIVDMTHALPMQ